jgi:hypothetical protein
MLGAGQKSSLAKKDDRKTRASHVSETDPPPPAAPKLKLASRRLIVVAFCPPYAVAPTGVANNALYSGGLSGWSTVDHRRVRQQHSKEQEQVKNRKREQARSGALFGVTASAQLN